jgi:putative ABC transport system ATP-binding protein
MNSNDRILQVERLTKTFGKDSTKTEALCGISFDVLEGEFLGIMGASGSGKTTLLNCIATMIKPSSGKVLLHGKDISTFNGAQLADYRGKEIGYLFQEFELLDNLTARENITLPLSLHGITGKNAENDIQQIAERLDITEVLEKFPSQMSGGQKQRVAAARALISNPSIVLADEPTGALDTKNSRILMDKLASINSEQHKTIMMVTHDANAASYCSRILFIQDGRLFHELRRKLEKETPISFYERIVTVMSQLGGGSANVL